METADFGNARQQLYVCVYASQVAGIVGMNRHKPVHEAFEQLWERTDGETYHAALGRAGRVTDDAELLRIMATHDDVKALVDKSLQLKCDSSMHVAGEYGDAQAALGSVQGLDTGERKVVDGLLRKNLYTNFGTRHESDILTHVRGMLRIDARTDDTFYKRRIGTVRVRGDDVPWFIGGKIDAIVVDEHQKRVVEIKNRINRLFYRVPAYENVQLQTYLALVGADEGLLVEAYRSDAALAPDLNAMRVARDDTWDAIVPRVAAVVGFLGRLLSDDALQDAYMASSRRSALITRLFPAAEPEFVDD
jgi:hypothetical protein